MLEIDLTHMINLGKMEKKIPRKLAKKVKAQEIDRLLSGKTLCSEAKVFAYLSSSYPFFNLNSSGKKIYFHLLLKLEKGVEVKLEPKEQKHLLQLRKQLW